MKLLIANCVLLFAGISAATMPAQTASPAAATKVYIFVRTDCPISNRYAPEIQRLQAKFQSQGVAFTLVYPAREDTAAAVMKNHQQYGYKIASRFGGADLIARSHVTITPEAAVFHGDALVYHGRIDNWYASFGNARSAPTTHELEDAIAATVAGRTPPVSYEPAIGCYISDLR